MPRFPAFAARTQSLTGSVFERYLPVLRALEVPAAKLHIGDSAEEPDAPLPLDESFRQEHPNWFQYPHTRGVGRLRRAIADYHAVHHGLDTAPDQILVTCGGTHALSVITQAIVDPGDEVLVLAPSWPFFRGMVRLAGGTVRELTVYTQEQADEELSGALEACLSPRTVAVYVNTPNNPSGRVLEASHRALLARFCRDHDLWMVADEAYDGMAYDGQTTLPMAVEAAPERTLCTFTFSKIHRFAGLRLGWLRGPQDVVDTLDRVLVHQVYSAPAVSQAMMIEPLRTRAEWAPATLAALQERRDHFLAALDLPIHAPAGTYFIFFDTSPYLSAVRDADRLLRELLHAGVAVSPGGDFGQGFGNWVRLCFAADTVERTQEAARTVRAVLLGDAKESTR